MMMLDPKSIRERLKTLKHLTKGDSYAKRTAHIYQDLIYIHTLRAIANGEPYPRQLANTALEAARLRFDKLY
jgi:hypothetical protein